MRNFYDARIKDIVSAAGNGPPSPAPPPPPPPPPPLPPGPCYKTGTKISGFLRNIEGSREEGSLISAASPQIVFGCANGPATSKDACFADYMLANGEWARAYGSHPTPLLLGDEAHAATIVTLSQGKWTITVTVEGKDAEWVWSSDDFGYMSASAVTLIDFTSKGASYTCATEQRQD